MNTPAPLSAECVLTDLVGGLAAARRFTRLTLLAWAAGVAVDDALLVVTELAANALRHGTGERVLRLSVDGVDVRVEVFDDNPAPPVRRPAGPDGGWGLALVDRLSTVRGTAPTGRGKVVWCVLPVPSAELAG
ncbi:ATP-binding protein [Amycolatopsis vancoresmycina]|uniref:Two-component system histidine kinase n=1 Tax=Amycolatopsis vancoresmycina DSM 44592 TaxID=1292037 RepID=R1G0N2_9PSEU|nr:ATP-binding protein [Amycolatopsis vancoresmycina]EOD65133.1 two-component system histidine kinase [Amycolatopsis vancoresmycina DSM 44592]